MVRVGRIVAPGFLTYHTKGRSQGGHNRRNHSSSLPLGLGSGCVAYASVLTMPYTPPSITLFGSIPIVEGSRVAVIVLRFPARSMGRGRP